ncbi:hypothetical protein ED733_006410 [Metarhizium rileyi]|uniref:Uncharacterized protein n=1 Tax=Metarhizium rileyi (strain RCEF 4871) TaxID=1649241 RepID=A0A5C6GFT9_METRR|nr:hypothetical protein ED733_006410 [Metarhizium rileyi]
MERASYPPYHGHRQDEIELYKRLRTIYEKHSNTWDEESQTSWFQLIPQISITRTNRCNITSHKIARLLEVGEITWAHFVILHAIYKDRLFSSKKIIRILLNKYPSANLDSYAFQKSYQNAPGETDANRQNTPPPSNNGIDESRVMPSAWRLQNNDVSSRGCAETEVTFLSAAGRIAKEDGDDRARSQSIVIDSIETSDDVSGPLVSATFGDDEWIKEGSKQDAGSLVEQSQPADPKRSEAEKWQALSKKQDITITYAQMQQEIGRLCERCTRSEQETGTLKSTVARQAKQIDWLEAKCREMQGLLDAFFNRG